MKTAKVILALIASVMVALGLGLFYDWGPGDSDPKPEVGRGDLSTQVPVQAETQVAGVSQTAAHQPNASPQDDDFSFHTLYAKAVVDPNAAEDLSYLASFCDGLRNSAGKKQRFAENPIWRQWSERCKDPEISLVKHIDLILSLGSEDYRRALELTDTPITGDDSKHPDAELREIMTKSNDHRAVAVAAFHYFNSIRLDAWIKAIDYRAPILLSSSYDKMNFALDLSTLIACRAGKNCAGTSIHALTMCLMAPGCTPGMDVEEIVRSRLSPVEWELAQRLLLRVGRQG